MTITVPNLERLTLEEMKEFLDGTRTMDFVVEGQGKMLEGRLLGATFGAHRDPAGWVADVPERPGISSSSVVAEPNRGQAAELACRAR